ncbi:MAG: hypothetical protein PVG78_03600, partial [Desulfobacterales bacterium]
GDGAAAPEGLIAEEKESSMAKRKTAEKEKEVGKTAQTVTVVGYVDEYDDEDGSTGIRITTEDAQSYRIHLDGKGKELFELVDEEVVLTGWLQKDRGGNRILRVKRYEVIDDYEDDVDEDRDDYDDYDDFHDDDDFRPRRRGTGTDE